MTKHCRIEKNLAQGCFSYDLSMRNDNCTNILTIQGYLGVVFELPLVY